MPLSDQVRKGLAYCVPATGRPVPMAWAFALKFNDPPINLYSVYHSPQGLPVDQARNACIEFAQQQKCEFVFFNDEDTVMPAATLPKLVFTLQNNPSIDIVGGVYFSKSDPPAPLVFRGNGRGPYWDWKVGELFWVTGIGMGCTLIRTSVFDRITRPYFLTVKADAHVDDVSKAEAWTEDLFACEKILQSYGWESSLDALDKEKIKTLPKPIWCDASIQCDHVDINTGKIYKLPWNSLPAVRRFSVGKKKILDLGCGEVGTIMKDGTPVRVDLRDDVQADYRCDVRALPFKTESFDVVFASHTLEHFSQKAAPAILDEWLRVLKVNGQLRLIVPDLTVAAQKILAGECNGDAWKVLYGEQSAAWDFHKTGFTPGSLKALLESRNLTVEKIWQEPPFNLFAEARKTQPIGTVGTGQGRAILRSEMPKQPELVGALKDEPKAG